MTLNHDLTSPNFRAILLVCLCASLPATSMQAASYTITDMGDDGVVNGTCTLREAIEASNFNIAIDACQAGSPTFTDRIHLNSGTYVVDLSSIGSDLDISDELEIRGAGPGYTIIDGSGGTQLDNLIDIQVGANSVLIEDVSLRGGNTTGQGGVVKLAAGPFADFRNVEISGGTATTGGGVYSAGDFSLVGGSITGNQTPAGSGGHGGGIASVGGSLDLHNVEISGNQADGNGGGIYSANNQILELSHSKVTDNVAGGSGGGLEQTADNFTIDWTEFARNQATIGGGMRTTGMGETTKSAFIDNVATIRGGGFADENAGIVRFSTITGNSAPLGAGVYADSGMTLLDSNTIARNIGDGVHNVAGVFFENNIVSESTGANCAGNAPAFGAFNLEDINTCGFVDSAAVPNFPNTDPMLGTLQTSGAPTPYLALLPGSPAIDVVTTEIRMNCEKMVDQRGYTRGRPRTPGAGAGGVDVFFCDIGAVEWTAPFVVDTLTDGVDADLTDDLCETAAATCSLRAAIQQANQFPGRTEVELGAGTHTLSIAGAGEDGGATGDLDSLKRINLRGAGAGVTLVDGGDLDRVLQIGSSGITIALDPLPSLIQDLTITGGDAGTDDGGGIFAYADVRLERVTLTGNQGRRGSAASGSFAATGATLDMLDSTVENNVGGMALYFRKAEIERSSIINNTSINFNGGGGEFVSLYFKNSTMSGNTADATGAFFAGRAILESSAIYDNSATFGPGGPFILDRTAIRNSIIANNRAGGVLDNCAMQAVGVSMGFNLTDGPAADCKFDDASDLGNTDPLLGALADNAGMTDTHLPLAGSPLIDMGDPASCPATDQRGLPRPQDGDQNGSSLCDVGPVELPEPGLALGLGAGGMLLAGLARRRARVAEARG